MGDEETMSWANNFHSIKNNGTVGRCPFCESDNTDYYFNPPEGAENYTMKIWCNDCKKALLGRAKATLPRNIGKLPEDVVLST